MLLIEDVDLLSGNHSPRAREGSSAPGCPVVGGGEEVGTLDGPDASRTHDARLIDLGLQRSRLVERWPWRGRAGARADHAASETRQNQDDEQYGPGGECRD